MHEIFLDDVHVSISKPEMELRCQFSGGCTKDNYDSCTKCNMSYCKHHIDAHKCDISTPKEIFCATADKENVQHANISTSPSDKLVEATNYVCIAISCACSLAHECKAGGGQKDLLYRCYKCHAKISRLCLTANELDDYRLVFCRVCKSSDNRLVNFTVCKKCGKPFEQNDWTGMFNGECCSCQSRREVDERVLIYTRYCFMI